MLENQQGRTGKVIPTRLTSRSNLVFNDYFPGLFIREIPSGRFGPNYLHQVIPDLFTVVLFHYAHLDVVRARPVDAGVSDVPFHFVAPHVRVDEGLRCPDLGPPGHNVPPGVGQVGPTSRTDSVVVPISPDADRRPAGYPGARAPFAGLERMGAGRQADQRPE